MLSGDVVVRNAVGDVSRGTRMSVYLVLPSDAFERDWADAVAALLAQQTRQSLPPSLTPSPLSPSLTPTPSPIPPSLTPTNRPPTRTPDLTPRAGSTRISPVDGMVMSYIPAGTFQMGSDSHFDNEKPIHSVTLDAFWMDQTEVTNAQYAMCVAAGSCRQPWSLGSFSNSSYYAEPRYADYPVIYVDWNRARDYCTWAGRELPTEAQWEYAARGGLAGRAFPWGDSNDERLANHCDKNCIHHSITSIISDGYAETAPVGSYPDNGYRLFDMAGNVWEWAADWFGPYSSAVVTNPSGPISGETRVTRSGSWYNGMWECGVYSREGRNPAEAYAYIGFRCALSP